MSFIYEDDDLLSKLLKSAQVVDDVKVNADYKSYLDMSNKLVDSIREKLTPKTDQVASAATAAMGVPNMNSLGNFLDFTVQNAITVGGQRVAYSANEDPPNLNNWLPINAEKSSVFVESVDQEGHRKALEGEYYVNEDLLKKYITSLTAEAAEKDAETQKMMKSLLGGIIEKVNSIFKTKLSTDYKKPEEKMDLTTVLTTFPVTLDDNQYNKDGEKVLTLGDIQSADAIKNWVNKNSIVVKTNEGEVGLGAQEFDFCIVVRTIYRKAIYLQSRFSDKKYIQFVSKMVEVGPTLKGPNGQACKISGDGSTSGVTSPVAPNAENLNIQLNALMSTLPFSKKNIDFSRINLFFEKIKPMMTNVPASSSYMQEVNSAIAKVQPMLKGSPTFPLGMQPRQFANMLNTTPNQTANRMYLDVIALLDQIIDGTRTVFEMFYSKYGPQLGNYKNQIVGQIGDRPTDYSVYYDNSNSLEGLRNAGNFNPTSGGA